MNSFKVPRFIQGDTMEMKPAEAKVMSSIPMKGRMKGCLSWRQTRASLQRFW
jgi:hypothetical protein